MNFIPDPEYRRIQELMPILCVDLLIRKGDYFLLVRRLNEPAKGEWWFPGGRVRKGETPPIAAARIAREETGLDTDYERFMGVYDTQFPTGPFGVPVHTVNLCYRLQARAGNLIRLDRHHDGFRWVPFSGLPDDLQPPLDRRLLPLIDPS